MSDVDVLLAQLRADSTVELADRAAEAMSQAAETLSLLADHHGYDTATLWWAAGTLSEAYAEILPYTRGDLPGPPADGGDLADDPERLTNVLDAVADALARAARVVDEPQRIHALAHAGVLAQQAREAFVNAKVVA